MNAIRRFILPKPGVSSLALTVWLLFAPGAGAEAGLAAASEPSGQTDRIERIDIGGRKLQMLTRGQGSPTVVIEAAMGEPAVTSGTWRAVINEISKTHRVVLYDRAGLGASDPASKIPRTSQDVADDLRALLTQAGLKGPHLLVGHSFGGLHIRMFASRYPEQVAGMVLVDASHPDQDRRWLAAFGPAQAGEPESLRMARQHLSSRTTPASNPEQIDPVATAAQIGAARNLGDKPLVILTHRADFKMDPGLPEENLKQIETVWTGIQDEYRRLSTRSTLFQSTRGGHNLPGEDAELVIQGIRKALEQIGASAR